jgi:hypothetical protein
VPPPHLHARHQKIDLGVSFADLSGEKHSLSSLIECNNKIALGAPNNFGNRLRQTIATVLQKGN